MSEQRLTERLTAELNRRIALAQAATQGPWTVQNSQWHGDLSIESTVTADRVVHSDGDITRSDAEHIVAWEPTVALAVLQAHKAIVEDVVRYRRWSHVPANLPGLLIALTRIAGAYGIVDKEGDGW